MVVVDRSFGNIIGLIFEDKKSKGMPGTVRRFHIFLVFFLDSLKLQGESDRLSQNFGEQLP
jgi:hypothetical protein